MLPLGIPCFELKVLEVTVNSCECQLSRVSFLRLYKLELEVEVKAAAGSQADTTLIIPLIIFVVKDHRVEVDNLIRLSLSSLIIQVFYKRFERDRLSLLSLLDLQEDKLPIVNDLTHNSTRAKWLDVLNIFDPPAFLDMYRLEVFNLALDYWHLFQVILSIQVFQSIF